MSVLIQLAEKSGFLVPALRSYLVMISLNTGAPRMEDRSSSRMVMLTAVLPLSWEISVSCSTHTSTSACTILCYKPQKLNRYIGGIG